MKKNLYLFRHGQSEFNKLNKMQGTATDSPLTSLGIEQASKIPHYLKDKNLDIIYSSHLKRAWKTGSIVAKALGIEIIKNKYLYEVLCNSVDGVLKEDLKEKFGEEFFKKWEGCNPEDDDMRFPDGESKTEARQRILKAVGNISITSSDDIIGFASHGFVIKQIIIACYNKYPEGLKNCEILHLEFDTEKYNEKNPDEAFSFVKRIRTDK